MSNAQRRAWKATRVLPPPPWLFTPVNSVNRSYFGGENPCKRGLKQISAKSGEGLISEKQQEQEKIQKFSSSDQRSYLSKGKNCLI